MYKKTFLPFVLIFTIFLSVLNSCNEPNAVESKTSNVSKESNISLEKTSEQIKPVGKIIGYKEIEENGKKRKVPIYYDPTDTNSIEPKALECDYYWMNVNQFDHYAPKSGKSLGIANDKPSLKTPTELHNTWGFSGYKIFSESDKLEKISLGYTYNDLMVAVGINNGNYTIPTGTFSKYYVGEPFENNIISVDKMINLANALYSLNPSATLVMDSYKDTPYYFSKYMTVLLSTTNTRIMCDQYYDGYIWYGHDQRAYWDFFKNNYGPRIYTHWIHILIDGIQGDFNMLFDKANSLGLSSLWLYAGNANNCHSLGICESLNQSNYNTYLTQFCNTAFNKGWLRKFIKQYKYWYHCPESYGDPCYCSETNSGWELKWIQYVGTIEVIHNP